MNSEIEQSNTETAGNNLAVDLGGGGDFNPFDPSRFAVDSDDDGGFGVKKLLLNIPVRKPSKQEFFRSHPEMVLRTHLIEFREANETYIVIPEVAQEIPGETIVKELTVCVNRQGNPFVWPVPVLPEDGRIIEWHTSAREIAVYSQSSWCRMVANMNLGSYELRIAEYVVEPRWPENDFKEIIGLAFKNHVIDDENHPLIRQLRGIE